MSSPGLPGIRKTLRNGEGLVKYHCNGQGAGALVAQGKAEETGFVRLKEKNLSGIYIKAAKTELDSPQSCSEGK